jgi:hydrogenase maturation protein HypF
LPPLIAVGAHLKNTIAVSNAKNIFISQHIGDLETKEAYTAFTNAIKNLSELYEIKPQLIVSDMHPDYLSTKFAQHFSLPHIKIQHHYAHILACMAENEISPPCLGIAWDGTGYGLDNTIWGGEFLLIKEDYSFFRIAHFRHFKLPGGEIAIKQPRRTALGILYEIFKEQILNLNTLPPLKTFSNNELQLLIQLLQKNINCPLTSSAGRLFDAVASIVDLRHIVKYEGQAAMELEFAIKNHHNNDTYPYKIYHNKSQFIIDWENMIVKILQEFQNQEQISNIAVKFHNTLVE